MAASYFTVKNASDISFVAATVKTILQIATPSNQRVRLLEWGIYFLGQSAADKPILVRLMRQGNAGTGTSITPVPTDEGISLAARTTALGGHSVEPTVGDVVKIVEVHPQFGYEYSEPVGKETIVGISSWLGIAVTAPAVIDARAWAKFEE